MRFRALIILLAVVLGVVGCGSSAGRQSQPAPPPAGIDATTTTTGLAKPARYQPLAGEPEAQAKKAASDVVQALTTYAPTSNPSAEVSSAIVSLGVPISIIEQAPRLLVEDVESTGEVVYPQYGGLTENEASVMVVVRQRLREPESTTTTVERIVDVRVARDQGRWRVTAIDSDGGEPVAEPDDLAQTTKDLLASTAVEIPDSARWDIYRGEIDQRVIDFMLELSREHTYSVAVIKTGHPFEVFGTDRESNHTRGRAVDVWKLDGSPILQSRGRGSELPNFIRKVRDMGLTEIGGPFDIDGPGGVSWTDQLHQDHLHLAFKHPLVPADLPEDER